MAGAAAVVVAAVAAVGLRSGDPTVEAGPGSGGPAGVAPPPAWFGEPQAGARDAVRSGRWVSTAIGRVSADGVDDPIVASVFDGTFAPLDALDGRTGWLGRTTWEPHGTLTFLVWSPRPGAVLTITTEDTGRTEDDLADLARWASTLDGDDWDALHRD